MPSRQDGRRRADAVRNHERVLGAAHAVFAERGLGAGVEEVARRAGVGRATVYRSYPTREDLVAVVARARLDWLAERVAAAEAREDAWDAFADVLLEAAASHAADRTLAECIAAARDLPALQPSFEAVTAAFVRLVARAQEAGALRRDVGWPDVAVLFAGLATQLNAQAESDPAVWRRYTTLLLDGLRAGRATPLP